MEKKNFGHSHIENQIEQKEEEISNIQQLLDTLVDDTAEQQPPSNNNTPTIGQSSSSSWLDKTNQSIRKQLMERFRYEKLNMAVDWRLKIKLQEVCPLEYYYDRLLLCVNREVFNTLDINHGCKNDMELVKDCSMKRERFLQVIKKQEKLQMDEMKSNVFYTGSGITEYAYKNHLEKSRKEYEKMMENFNNEAKN